MHFVMHFVLHFKTDYTDFLMRSTSVSSWHGRTENTAFPGRLIRVEPPLFFPITSIVVNSVPDIAISPIRRGRLYLQSVESHSSAYPVRDC